ncbi:MAG: type II toxin-antitoxin system HicB family antitoxin [Nitrosopumilaceae archaeon]
MKVSNFGKGRYTIIVHKESEGGYSGQCLELPGAISQGETMVELKKNMTDAIQLVLQSIHSRANKSKKITINISA